MAERAVRSRRIGAATLLLALAAALTAWALFRSSKPPTGPVSVAWDRESCARCRMLIGEPRFAAQLQTRDGRILNFDDPGCLLIYTAEQTDEAHAIYFHHLLEERWIDAADVVFVGAEPTPMGYGLGAVDGDAAASVPLTRARERVLEQESARRGVRDDDRR